MGNPFVELGGRITSSKSKLFDLKQKGENSLEKNALNYPRHCRKLGGKGLTFKQMLGKKIQSLKVEKGLFFLLQLFSRKSSFFNHTAGIQLFKKIFY